MMLQSIWCIDMVGEITINDLNLLLEIGIYAILRSRDSVTSVQFCDFVNP